VHKPTGSSPEKSRRFQWHVVVEGIVVVVGVVDGRRTPWHVVDAEAFAVMAA
jgi:hypothetical protein